MEILAKHLVLRLKIFCI